MMAAFFMPTPSLRPIHQSSSFCVSRDTLFD
jgi:hypothetical protein